MKRFWITLLLYLISLVYETLKVVLKEIYSFFQQRDTFREVWRYNLCEDGSFGVTTCVRTKVFFFYCVVTSRNFVQSVDFQNIFFQHFHFRLLPFLKNSAILNRRVCRKSGFKEN